jgi:invasion protein IalB
MSLATPPAAWRGPLGLFTLGSFAAALALSTPGFAQQQPARPRAAPAKPAAPAPAPAAPAAAPAQAPAADPNAAPATGPTVVQVKPEPSQPDWTKVCGKDPASNVEVCYTTRDFVSDQGQPVLALAVYDAKGGPQGPQKIVRFLMPLGLMLQPGIRFAVDQGQPTPGRYAICFPNGCFAEAGGLKDDFINLMKKGTNMNVSVQNQVAREVTFAVPLAGFGKAFDGPAIDPKELEAQQKKLQEELEKRSDELRKRLEQSGGAATPGAPASAPTAAAPSAPKQ